MRLLKFTFGLASNIASLPVRLLAPRWFSHQSIARESVGWLRPPLLLGAIAACLGTVVAQEIVPYPRAVIKTDQLLEWTFKSNPAGWTAAHDSAIAATGGVLRIQSSGGDPYLFGPPVQIDGPVTARLRLKCDAGGNGQIFWVTAALKWNG